MKNLLLLSLLSLAPLAQAALPDQPVVHQYRGVENIVSVMETGNHEVLVGDSGQGVIIKYCPQGNVLLTYHAQEAGPNVMVNGARISSATTSFVPAQGFMPSGMDIDANGRLVVADSAGNRLEIFNADGSLAAFIGVETAEQEAAVPSPEVQATEPYVYEPRAVAFGPNGRLYVADAGHNRIAVFDSNTGGYLFAWGTPGYSGNYKMSYPMGVAVSGNRVYVADAGNARVLVYDTEGVYVSTIGRRGLGFGEFDSPFAVGVDGEGRLWVGDNGAQKMVVFDAEGQPIKEYGQNAEGIYFEDLRSIFVSKTGTVLTADGAGAKVFAWETGVAVARYEGKVNTPPAGKLADALLAFGPVPAKAGQTLHLRVPFQAQELRWELFSADMRRVAEGTESNRDRAEIIQTAELGSGVYMVRMQVTKDGESRNSIQKIVITR